MGKKVVEVLLLLMVLETTIGPVLLQIITNSGQEAAMERHSNLTQTGRFWNQINTWKKGTAWCVPCRARKTLEENLQS